MSDTPTRTPRTIAVADHLWDVLAVMSSEMGVDREGLINQALFAFARANGFLQPGQPHAAHSVPPPVAATPSPLQGTPAPSPVVAFRPAAVPASAPPPQEPARPQAVSSGPTLPPPLVEEEPQPGSTVALKMRPGQLTHDPIDAFMPQSSNSFDLGTRLTPDEISAAQERVLQQADALEREVRGGGDPLDGGFDGPSFDGGFDEPEPSADPFAADPSEGTPAGAEPGTGPVEPTLVLYADGDEVDRVSGERFIIGRGKHCDLIINSGKVSREHAAIVREGTEFFIEDLGSSNGTWFDKKRITRRRIEDGDEYYVCSEKITCRLE